MKTLRLVAAVIGLAACASAAAAAPICVSPDGKKGCYTTINAAVAAALPYQVVQVQAGMYNEEVTITKPLSLIASGIVTINATNKDHGIFVNGMATAPKPGVTGVVIAGFQVLWARYEGILVANAADVTIDGNHIAMNNQALNASSSTCPDIPAYETNEGFDCGEGIHLMATVNSIVTNNEIEHNAGGILLSDETGPTQDNVISKNNVHDNPFDCGITLASHGPATSVIPTAKLPYGILHNTIMHNYSARNGLGLFGAGAGVGIFAPFPGTINAGNIIFENDLIDNGLPGVAMHNHAAAPAPAPPVNLNENVIIGNRFSGNGADTEDTATSGTAGINIASQAAVWGTVITGNTFQDQQVDITFNAPDGWVTTHFNNFSKGIGVANLKGGMVNATENWWHCNSGPTGNGLCASLTGTVLSDPWLNGPLQSDTQN